MQHANFDFSTAAGDASGEQGGDKEPQICGAQQGRSLTVRRTIGASCRSWRSTEVRRSPRAAPRIQPWKRMWPRQESGNFCLRQARRLTSQFEALLEEPIFPNIGLGLQWLPRMGTRQLLQPFHPISQNRMLQQGSGRTKITASNSRGPKENPNGKYRTLRAKSGGADYRGGPDRGS